MRVLFVSPIYRPEMGAFANRLYPLTQHLVSQGHEVFVATGMPNYPKGEVFEGYRGLKQLDETIEGVKVLRTASYVAPRNISKLSTLRSYLGFLPAAYRGGLRAGKVDVVVSSSPPIFPIVPSLMLARRSKARLVFDIRDLWPDEIIACLGAKEDSKMVGVIRRLERLAYRRADLITATTRSFIETVTSRGADPRKVALIPNGADMDLFKPMAAPELNGKRWPYADRFVVMYVGLLGLKHGLDVLVDAAERLRDQPDILFFIAGSGAKEKALRDRVHEMRLDNVVFGGEQKVEDIPALLAHADVCVSCLDTNPYFQKILSVKLFEYMACAKPIIGLHTGESARLIQESGAGTVVPPGDTGSFVNAILEMRNDSDRQRLGEAGRRYVERHYSRQVTARRFECLLEQIVESPATLDVEFEDTAAVDLRATVR